MTTQQPCRLRGRPERGLSTAAEAAILVPAVMLLFCVATACFRVWQVGAELTETTAAAARAATSARSASEARLRVHQVFAHNSRRCQHPSHSSDLSGFSLPVGTPGDVHVSAACRVSFSDILVPGLPGGVTVRAAGTSTLDSHRERRP